jgi:hypothetical protein
MSHAPRFRFWQRLRFVILLILAAETGFSPAALFLNEARWLPWMALAPTFVGLGYIFQLRAVAPRAITFRETIGVYYAAVFETAAACLFLFLLYGLTAALVAGARWVHIEPQWAKNLAWWTTAATGAMLLFGNSGTAADLLASKLFPTTGIGNAPLFPGITARRILGPALWTLGSIVSFVAGTAFHYRPVLIATPFCMIIAGITFHDLLETRAPAKQRQTALAALRKLLEAGGYTVIDRLQTGKTDLDRLLNVFDMVAERQGYALAIQLLEGDEGAAPVSWTEAASVKSATSAVYEAAEVCGRPVRRVRPMLALCGRRPDRSLKVFTSKEGILVAELPEWKTIEAIAAGTVTGDNLQGLAQSHLGLRVEVPQEPT